MEILASRTPGRRPAPSGGPHGASPTPPTSRGGLSGLFAQAEALFPAALGIAAVAAIIAWEVTRPSLPVPFELAAAARWPAAPAWAPRLAMAALSVAGSLALYLFLARTAERRAGLYAVAVLATVPAWFVHGRMMTGAMVPMACSVTVLAGLGVATLAPGAKARAVLGGYAVALVAALASVAATRWGAPARGLLVVAGVPVVAVGAAGWLWARGPGATGEARGVAPRTSAERDARLRAALLLGLGGLLVVASVVVVASGSEGALADLLLGSRATSAVHPTFESPIAVIAYGLVPWTPLVPLALARRPSGAGHLAVMIGAILAVAVHAALASRAGAASSGSTLVGVGVVAGAVAMMLRSLEDARRPPVTLVATVLVLGWLVAHDVKIAPERVLVAFGATDTVIPAAHAAASSLAIRSSLWLCMALAAVALVVPRTWLPSGRGLAIVAGGVFAGLVLRAHAYPELLMRLSPGAAFDAWASHRRSGEPLGLVGVDRRSVAFASGTAVVPQTNAPTAGRWLAAAAHGVPDEPRRFLALATPELPGVNAEYRAAHGRNVPILAGHESATLLAVSALATGERSESPLDAVVLAAPPPGLRPLGAVLDDRLDAVGWQLVDDKGRGIDAVPRGSRSAHVRFFVKVRAATSGAYCTFLHIDHTPTRFGAEHRQLPYPMGLWREGDVVVDDYDIKLPAHFRAGSYRMYWGVGVLPCEDDHRMHVTSGPTDGHDRIPAGTLEVR